MQPPPAYPPQQQQMVILLPAAPGQQVVDPSAGQVPQVVYPPGVQVPQFVYTQPGPTSYIVQNAAPSQQSRDSNFSTRGGVVTGILQIVCGVLAIILSGASYAYSDRSSTYEYYSSVHSYIGMGIWSAILFFLPTGILGVLTAKRNSCVIVAYLVMCILAALASSSMIVYEEMYAEIYSTQPTRYCNYRYSYTYPENSSDTGSVPTYYCNYKYGEQGAIALHSVLGIIALVECVAAIVGSAFCCGGLCCRNSRATPPTTALVYYNAAGQPQPNPGQTEAHVVQGAD